MASIKEKLHVIKEKYKGKKMAPAFNAFHTFLFTATANIQCLMGMKTGLGCKYLGKLDVFDDVTHQLLLVALYSKYRHP